MKGFMKNEKTEKNVQGFRQLITRCFSREALPYWTMLCIALAVRIAHQIIMSRNDPMYGFLLSGGDNHTYDRWALEISQTFWLGWDRLPFLHGPLYPYFLGLAYLRFGYSFDTAAWSQRVIGALTVVLIFYLARRIFGKRAGWCAGVGAAFCPLFLLYEGEILVETLVLFVHVAALCIFVEAAKRKTVCWWLFCGIALGVCALGRPNAMLFIPVAAIWAAWITPGKWRQKIAAALLIVVAAAVAISPAALLNTFVGGRFHLVTHSGGVNFYIGNAPDATGVYFRPPSLLEIRKKEGKHEYEIEWNGYLWELLKNEPLAVARNIVLKTKLFWQSGELPHNINFYLKQSFSPFLLSPFRWGLIAPLGLIGMFLSLKRRSLPKPEEPHMILLAFFVLYMGSIILVFVMSRLRLPALAVSFVFAGYAVSWCIGNVLEAWRTRRFSPGMVRVCCTVIICVLLVLGLQSGENPLLLRWNDYLNLGSAYEVKGNHELALDEYQKALEKSPKNVALQQICSDLRANMGLK